MSRPSWKPGRRHGTQRDPIAEAARGQGLAVGRGREGDPGVGVEVVDVVGGQQAVHRRVDRRRRAAPAVQAVVERGDHLVLALDARIDVGEGAQPVEPQDRQARRRSACPRSPPEPLTHRSSTGVPVTGSVAEPLAEVFPPA